MMLFQSDVFILDGQKMRLVHLENATNTAWCIDIDQDLAWPQALRYDDIQNLPVVEKPYVNSIDPSPARIKGCEKAWSRLQPLLKEHGTNLLVASHRNFALENHAEQVGCSKRTLHRDLRRYWQRGMSKFALMPDFDKSGRFSTSAADSIAKVTAGRGRKTSSGERAYQLAQADTKQMSSVIEKYYLKGEVVTASDAFLKLLREHYYYEDGNLDRHINPVGARPSLRQFQYFLKKTYDIEVQKRRRLGDSDFEREHRKVLGTVLADCQGVGHYYEIDATIADVYLVSSHSTQHIIGKPTIYLIIDRKSRLIVGFYVGLENPSWDAAKQAILSISEDKRHLCEMYGVDYNPHDWPAHQVFPMEFLADRGEMISSMSSFLAEGLHVTVTNLPSKRPDWKPLVECGFKLIHGAIRPIAPAYDPPSNATRRRGKHYDKDACLTLKDFGNILMNTIIKHNRREILNYELTPFELMAGIRPSPIALWNHGIVTRAGQLTRYEASHVQLSLLRKGLATVTERGIDFMGCFYSFQGAISQKWFEKARQKRFKVTVSFDSRLVNSIFVHSLNGKGQPQLAELTERSANYRGLSFEEVGFYQAHRTLLRIESGEQRLQNTIALHDITEPTTAAAKRKRKLEATGVSRTARRAAIKPQRLHERSIERRETANLKTITNSAGSEPEVVSIRPQSVSQTSALATTSHAMDAKLAAARARMLL